MTDDLPSAIAKTNRIMEEIAGASESFLDDVAAAIVDEARSNLQNQGSVNTGELLASIRVLGQGEGFRVVGSDVKQAAIIEYGRGPVVPVHAKVLRWVDKDTGEVIFSKYSGPVQPQPYFEPAVLAVTERMAGIFAVKQQAKIQKI